MEDQSCGVLRILLHAELKKQKIASCQKIFMYQKIYITLLRHLKSCKLVLCELTPEQAQYVYAC